MTMKILQVLGLGNPTYSMQSHMHALKRWIKNYINAKWQYMRLHIKQAGKIQASQIGFNSHSLIIHWNLNQNGLSSNVLQIQQPTGHYTMNQKLI